MKITINQIRLPYNHLDNRLGETIERLLKLSGPEEIITIQIKKKSIDARKKQQLMYIYEVDVETSRDCFVDNKNIMLTKPIEQYKTPVVGLDGNTPPVIIGTGPAGLFCALILAEAGLRPIVYERGSAVEERINQTETFFKTGQLDLQSNIQFGEGGAGTFSDGKLSTGVKDKFGRKEKVLNTFYEAGAKDEILYSNKPHIGTDYLITVVANMRRRIIELGGEIHFNHFMEDILIEDMTVKGLVVKSDEAKEISVNQLVLAIGHSARDTFTMLSEKPIEMEPKAFAIGLRIEHPQVMINESQYGKDRDRSFLPAADYKLTYRTHKGRGVYSFCMCPGGYVVNSSSESGHAVCNGMSYFARDAVNANAALLVNVGIEDFGATHVLAGMEFQRKWEKKAYELGKSNFSLPVQTLKDFKLGKVTKHLGSVKPSVQGKSEFADLNECLPEFVSEAIKEALPEFDTKIKGFDRNDAILIGVETRSSSPVRIVRNEEMISNIAGVYPCGEGAGYAGGIMSAAIDGIKVAEMIIQSFQNNK
ncbi:MAG: FAD-dependent oxidoreductase [Vallitaleaceae bacterium]|nr:FAD-dependent oxidoreductase [Vallitaleaceae bacterium]